MKKLRVALIGYGRSGRDIHAFTLGHMKDRFEIVAAAELDDSRRAMQQRELGCEVYSDYRAFLGRGDIDLVVNASFSHMHPAISIDLVEGGLNVLCEKPMAQTVQQADRMIDAQKSGARLAIFQQSRYAPYFAKVREVIESGKLGRIVQIGLHFNGYARRWDWQCIQQMGGGNLYNTGPHPLDQALALMGGEEVPDVHCFMDRALTSGDAEDYVKLLLTLPGRPLVDIEISSCCAYPQHTYHIQGTRGGLIGSMTDLKWKYWVEGEMPERPLQKDTLKGEGDTPLYCSEALRWHEESWEASDEQKDMFLYMGKRFYGMLYDALIGGTPFAITPEQVRRQIAVMQEAHGQSALWAPLGELFK